MRTITLPVAPKGPKSSGSGLTIALVVVVALLVAVGLWGFLKSRSSPVAKVAETSSVPSRDAALARAALEGYLKAASVSDAQKLLEFSGVAEGHPIVGSYKILREVSCTTEVGSAQEIRGDWERIRAQGELEKSARALQEVNVDWHGLDPTDAFTAFSAKHPLLAGAIHSDAGLLLFPENAFSVDGNYEVTACAFVVDLELQSKAGTRLWKREQMTMMRVATVATTPMAGKWLVIGRQEVGR